MKEIEKDMKEQRRNREEYYATNKGNCDECPCLYESCAYKTIGGLCAYENLKFIKE